MGLTERHPSIQAVIRRLEPDSNLPDTAREISGQFYEMALWLADKLPDDPDLADGLRKLWEAKNCVVYLAVISDD